MRKVKYKGEEYIAEILKVEDYEIVCVNILGEVYYKAITFLKMLKEIGLTQYQIPTGNRLHMVDSKDRIKATSDKKNTVWITKKGLSDMFYTYFFGSDSTKYGDLLRKLEDFEDKKKDFETTIVNSFSVNDCEVNTYNTLNYPFFLAEEIARAIDYGKFRSGEYNINQMVNCVRLKDRLYKRTPDENGRKVLYLSEQQVLKVLKKSRKSKSNEVYNIIKLNSLRYSEQGQEIVNNIEIIEPPTNEVLIKDIQEETTKQPNNVPTIFNFDYTEVRTLMIEDEPYFVGKDVAVALGYSNSSKAVMVHVDEEDKVSTMMPHTRNGNLSQSKTTLINESGLYSLIFSSKLDSAKRFKRWVTSEVLPTLRKTGRYIANTTNGNNGRMDSYMIEDPVERAYAWIEEQKDKVSLKDTVSNLVEELKVKEQQIQNVKQKYLVMYSNVAAYSVSEFCGDFGLTPVQLNKVLKDIGVQKKVDNVWKIDEQYDTEGYVLLAEGRDPYGDKYMFTKWTEKGIEFIKERLGQLTLVEAV